MSLDSQAAASLTVRQMLAPTVCANTAAATSGAGFWIDTQDLSGSIAVIVDIGAVTGSVAGQLQSASDANGTGAANIAGYAFGPVSTSDQEVNLVIPKSAMPARYLGFVGTIVTGPVTLGAVAVGA